MVEGLRKARICTRTLLHNLTGKTTDHICFKHVCEKPDYSYRTLLRDITAKKTNNSCVQGVL